MKRSILKFIISKILLAIALITLLSGCIKQTKKIEMPAFYILAGKDNELGVDYYDPYTLMEEGIYSYYENDMDKASLLFNRLLNKYKKSFFRSAAIYNLGLINEHLRLFHQSEKYYKKIVKEYSDSIEYMPSIFRLVLIYQERAHYKKATALLVHLLSRERLTSLQQIEATARLGHCMLLMGYIEEAEVVLKRCTELFYKYSKVARIDDKYYLAQSYFLLARICHKYFINSDVIVPDAGQDTKKAQDALEKKATWMLAARKLYLASIRAKDPYWAVASGYKIGSLYGSFYHSIVNSSVPNNLSGKEKKYYKQEIKNQMRSVLSNSVQALERTWILANTANIKGKWFLKIRKKLNAVEDIFMKEYFE